MKQNLTRNEESELYHIDDAGRKVQGKNPKMSGDCSGLRGDLDECEISDEERERGVNIQDLVKK